MKWLSLQGQNYKTKKEEKKNWTAFQTHVYGKVSPPCGVNDQPTETPTHPLKHPSFPFHERWLTNLMRHWPFSLLEGILLPPSWWVVDQTSDTATHPMPLGILLPGRVVWSTFWDTYPSHPLGILLPPPGSDRET